MMQEKKVIELDRLNNVLYFLAKKCTGIDAELRNVGLQKLRDKWHATIASLNDGQLSVGKNRMADHPEPFIQPERFRFLAYGLIDTRLAFEQAKDRIYNHAAVYHAAFRANIYSGGSDEQLYQRFTRAYNYMCDKVLNGETLPALSVSEALSTPVYKKKQPPTEAQKKLAREHLNKIYSKLGENRKLV